MSRVTIVGSDTPSTYLARGERRGPVELTDELRKLIRGGYVNVIEYHVSKPDPVPVSAPEPDLKTMKRPRRRPAPVDDVELPTDLDSSDG